MKITKEQVYNALLQTTPEQWENLFENYNYMEHIATTLESLHERGNGITYKTIEALTGLPYMSLRWLRLPTFTQRNGLKLKMLPANVVEHLIEITKDLYKNYVRPYKKWVWHEKKGGRAKCLS